MSLRLFIACGAIGLSLSAASSLLAQGAVGGATGAPPAAPAAAAPATDDPAAAAVAAYQAEAKRVADSGLTGQERYDAMKKAANDALGALKFDTLTVDNFEKLTEIRLINRGSPEMQTKADERLATLAKDTGETGARAALVRASFNPTPTTQDEASWKAAQVVGKQRLLEAMNHPGLAKAVEANKAKLLFAGGGVDGELADGAYCDALAKVVAMPLTPDLTARLWGAYVPLADDGATASPEAREKLRLACADKIAKAIGTPSEGGGAAAPGAADAAKDRQRKMLEDARLSFNGAFAKGQLVGHTAPDIDFQWSNLPGGAKKLSDLKGKVVVVDFWATWCGPCVGSFPQVRDLQARYKDYPVTIVGVTDMQGTPRPQVAAGQKLEWKPDVQFPALEAWSKDKEHEMTWPIAVGTGNVFNPEYGVMGIPHVVIIDPEGKVRYRGLHPAMEPEKKHEYIDGLLKEFKMKYPGA